jgi:hypothetical protein
LSQNTVFTRINRLIENEFFSSLVKIRNDIAHGAEPSDALAVQHLSESEEKLQDFTKSLWQNLNFEIVLPIKLQFDGRQFEIDAALISGSNNALPKVSYSTATPVISNQPYLLVTKENNLWVNLFPFIVIEASNEPTAWKIMVYDGIKMEKNLRTVTGEEFIRYIDISSGQRNAIPAARPISKMLPSFITGL